MKVKLLRKIRKNYSIYYLPNNKGYDDTYEVFKNGLRLKSIHGINEIYQVIDLILKDMNYGWLIKRNEDKNRINFFTIPKVS